MKGYQVWVLYFICDGVNKFILFYLSPLTYSSKHFWFWLCRSPITQSTGRHHMPIINVNRCRKGLYYGHSWCYMCWQWRTYCIWGLKWWYCYEGSWFDALPHILFSRGRSIISWLDKKDFNRLTFRSVDV